MTAKQLAERLMQQPDAIVVVTWEGTMQGLSVYDGAPGTIIIDADDGFYRDRFEGKYDAKEIE